LKVRTTYTIYVDCDLDKCVAKNLDLTFSNHVEEQENMENIIRKGFGYPDPDKISIRVGPITREPYYKLLDQNV
jgi:hypothetical protein